MKSIKIFISSTFNDMQAERDVVMTRVSALINKTFAREGIFVQFIDLRWGVNTGDEETDKREALVLQQCIREIRESHPFFIAFLGERYGWIPPQANWQQVIQLLENEHINPGLTENEPRSVTDMEIMLGAMASEDFLKRSLFCFRDPACLADIPFAERQRFVENDPAQAARQQALKKEIKEMCNRYALSPNILSYSPYWNGKQLDGLENLAQELTTRLAAMIRMELADTMVDYASPEKKESEVMEAYFKQKLLPGYVPDQSLQQAVNQCIYHTENTNHIYLQSTSFGTESAFLAWIAETYSKDESLLILKHSAGLSSLSRNSCTMLKRWLIELATLQEKTPLYLMDENIPLEKLQCLLADEINETGKKAVLLIDNAQFLDRPELWEHTEWAPKGSLLVVHAWRSWPFQLEGANTLPPLDGRQAEQLFDTLFGNSGKTLPAVVKKALLEKHSPRGFYSACLPGWIKLAVKYLNIYTSSDVAVVKKGTFADEGLNISHYQLQLVEQMPYYPEPLFELLIERIGQEYGMQLTTDIVMLWSLVRNGITDSDLAALLHDEWNALDFSCIKGWMSDLLCEEWDTQRIALAYDFGYDSSQNRRERAQQLTGELLKYLVGREDTDNPLLLDNLLHCTLMSGYLDLLPHIFAQPDSLLYRKSLLHLQYDIMRFNESYLDFLLSEIEKKPYKEQLFRVLTEVQHPYAQPASDNPDGLDAWVWNDVEQTNLLMQEMEYLKHAGMLNLYHCLISVIFLRYLPAWQQASNNKAINTTLFYLLANRAICMLRRDSKNNLEKVQDMTELMEETATELEAEGISVKPVLDYFKEIYLYGDNQCGSGSIDYIDSYVDTPMPAHLSNLWCCLLLMEYENGDFKAQEEQPYQDGNEDTLIRLYYALATHDQETLGEWYFKLMERMKSLNGEEELLYGIRYILVFTKAMYNAGNWQVMQTLLSVSWKNLRDVLQNYPNSRKGRALAVVVFYNYASLFDYYVSSGILNEEKAEHIQSFIDDAEALLDYACNSDWYGSPCILATTMLHSSLEFCYKRQGRLDLMIQHGMNAIGECERLLKLLPDYPDILRMTMATYGNFGQDMALFYPGQSNGGGLSSLNCAYNEHYLAYTLYDIDPDNQQNKTSLILAAKNYANALLASGQDEKACEVYQEASKLYNKWKKKGTMPEDIKRLLMFFNDEMSECYWKLGKQKQAYALNQQAINQLEQEHLQQPNNRRLLVDLLASLLRRVNFDLNNGLNKDTIKYLNRSLELYDAATNNKEGSEVQLEAMFFILVSCYIRYNALTGQEDSCLKDLTTLDRKCMADYQNGNTAFIQHLTSTLDTLFDWCIENSHSTIARQCLSMELKYKELLINDGLATPEAIGYTESIAKKEKL